MRLLWDTVTQGMNSRTVRILALSDLVDRRVYSEKLPEIYPDVDLVVGCGDLPFYYLEHVVTMFNCPVLYVHGNHDAELQALVDGRYTRQARGCLAIDGQVRGANGLVFMGLGGSIQYIPNAPHQYTEGQMRARVASLLPRLLMNRIIHGRFLDVLVTHSAPYGIHDGRDRAHVGFRTFLQVMARFKPRILLHGHTHDRGEQRSLKTRFHHTTVISVFPVKVIELGPYKVREGGRC